MLRICGLATTDAASESKEKTLFEQATFGDFGERS